MIKGKTIYFGYGTILVSSSPHTIHFAECKPPQKINSDVSSLSKDIETIQDAIICGQYKELKDCYDQLENIGNSDLRQVKLDDYILDFTNFNPKSVEVVRRHLCIAMYILQLGLAC